MCDPDYCVTSAVEVNVLPVDEFPPQFVGADPDLGFQFFVPYGSPPGFVVGVVRSFILSLFLDLYFNTLFLFLYAKFLKIALMV